LTARNDYGRYRAVTERNLAQLPEWHWIDPQHQEAIQVVSRVLPFRTNEYVVRELIDWGNLPRDPIFQLVFPQRGMLSEAEYESVRRLLERAAPQDELAGEVSRIRYSLNPHPAGQLTHNVPRLNGRPLPGLQHKYRETVLFFPAQGQTCHAYCTYCFRWAQFVGMPEVKFESRETEDLIAYLKANPCVSDVLITGGDPMIMKTKVLRKYIEPLLNAGLENVQTIRIGTKSLAYWPQRFVTDNDADDCLRLFEQIVAAGKHLAVMAHYSHPAELRPEIAREAVRRVRSTGAQLRMQAPIIRHVNDNAQAWAELWREGLRLGMIPYYMFIERDTGARSYFEVPLARCHEIFRDAYVQVSGLGRTVRGPSMSAFPGKVRICGVTKVRGEKVFALEMIQARNPEWVGRPFFAKFDPHAAWLDQLEPAFGERKFLFESDEDERHGLHASAEFWGPDGADVRPV
jgi:KamA family protein